MFFSNESPEIPSPLCDLPDARVGDDQKVAAFDKFLTSFKFLKPPGTETAAPKSSAKPTKKK